ncbi:hypothetical protein [Microseira sp. BLCC-F43]
MTRKIFACFERSGIFVYQAFKHSIADEAGGVDLAKVLTWNP